MIDRRIFLIVMDSVGIGALPDAAAFGDAGADTLGHIASATGGIRLPTLGRFGIGNLARVAGVPPVDRPDAFALRMGELSAGKDTMTGHWELMGLKTAVPFQTFTDTGFPDELVAELARRTGRGIIGNKAASGTEILVELGPRQLRTGELIVYTSADSVLQIAAHEAVIPLKELYEDCRIARELTLSPRWKVGRVIARPYVGNPQDGFRRTPNRHDYALSPSAPTVLDALAAAGYAVISIGKIRDIFNGSGITAHHSIVSNHDGMEKTAAVAGTDFAGLCFVNLVDFDAMYGHRRDPHGYKAALEEFDRDLAALLPRLRPDDLLLVTADHGNDPTAPGSDHTREYVPLLIHAPGRPGRVLPDADSFAAAGATVAAAFGVTAPAIGTNLLPSVAAR